MVPLLLLCAEGVHDGTTGDISAAAAPEPGPPAASSKRRVASGSAPRQASSRSVESVDSGSAAGRTPRRHGHERGGRAGPALRWRFEDWARQARCLGMNVELFFGTEPEEIAIAKAVCGRCPVQLPCLGEAIGDPGLLGVWGGASESERRSLRRRSRASSKPLELQRIGTTCSDVDM